jgi:hypothetical protein
MQAQLLTAAARVRVHGMRECYGALPRENRRPIHEAGRREPLQVPLRARKPRHVILLKSRKDIFADEGVHRKARVAHGRLEALSGRSRGSSNDQRDCRGGKGVADGCHDVLLDNSGGGRIMAPGACRRKRRVSRAAERARTCPARRRGGMLRPRI